MGKLLYLFNGAGTSGPLCFCRGVCACFSAPSPWTRTLLDKAWRDHTKDGFAEGSFDLTSAHIQNLYDTQDGLCFWLNVPMELETGDPFFDIKIARLTDTEGFVKSNTILVTRAAKRMCKGLSPEEIEIALEHLTLSLQDKLHS